jgi:hypothetical protein
MNQTYFYRKKKDRSARYIFEACDRTSCYIYFGVIVCMCKTLFKSVAKREKVYEIKIASICMRMSLL